MISKKRSNTVQNAETQRALNEIYMHLNELIDAVNGQKTEATPKTKGKTGDIRVVKSGKDSSKLQIRTSNGWANLVDSTGEILTTNII